VRDGGGCRKHDISTATFYKWKAKFGGLDVSDARRLKALEEENGKLKKLLAEAMLDNAMLKDIASKNGDARRQARGHRSPVQDTPGERAAGVCDSCDRSQLRALSQQPSGRCCPSGASQGVGSSAPAVRLPAPLCAHQMGGNDCEPQEAERALSRGTAASAPAFGAQAGRGHALADDAATRTEPAAGRSISSAMPSPTAAASASWQSSTTSPANAWLPTHRCRACGWSANSILSGSFAADR
jgi:putative transposase